MCLFQLQIWDTAGQERFRSITQSYYRSAHAIVLVYDVACQPSFDCLPEWLGEIEQYANRRVLKILVGNKVDKEDEREIPERIGKNFGDANAFDYFLETSALDATNVDRLFHEVAMRLTNDMKRSDERCSIPHSMLHFHTCSEISFTLFEKFHRFDRKTLMA
ncbi:unnamed protein product, partial [Anisakis simplex]|uniref:Ras-related protein Rab-30 (inferred by orthology to a human protein) n=1 Tax=Anisakis simplex TaxID=6269 RepID=A0A0M3JIG0_ANISI